MNKKGQIFAINWKKESHNYDVWSIIVFFESTRKEEVD